MATNEGQNGSNSSLVDSAPSPEHLSNAWQVLNEFRHRGLFCDVILKVDNLRFPAHRLVLCTCSDYFKSLFLGGWSSSEKQEVEIPGITPMVMATFLNFAYTGQITVTQSNVYDLLPAADQFLFDHVKTKCSDFLKRQLTLDNCIKTRDYARHYFCSSLIDAATNFMLRNFEDVSKSSEDYLQLCYEDLKALLGDDKLNARAEENVCEAIFRWVSHDRNNRLIHFTNLLKCVRLGLLDPEYFMTKVKGHTLVLESLPECRTLIRETMKVLCELDTRDNQIIPGHENTITSLLRPRLPFEVLLAIGGWSGGSPTNAIEAFDPRAETWLNASTLPDSSAPGRCKTVADLPCAYHSVVFVKGFVYVIGGFDGGNYFNTVKKMNVATLEWIQEPCMLHKRCYVSVAVSDRKIYALGGMNGERRLSSGELYNPARKTWSDLPDMNEKRSDACATSLDGKIYIAGGFNGQECLFTAEFYDPQFMSWTRITPMRSRRSGVSIIAYHGLVYAIGGFDGVNRLRHAEAYSPVTNSWRNISNMASPRSNFGIEVVDGKLVVVGGYNGQRTTADVEAYDDSTNEWYPVKDMHISRSGLSCCVVSGVSHEILKTFCIPRDESNLEEENRDRALTPQSMQSIDDDETTPYYTLTPPNDLDLEDNAIVDNESV